MLEVGPTVPSNLARTFRAYGDTPPGCSLAVDHLVGLVIKVSVSTTEDPEFESRFFGSSRTSDVKIGTPVATLPGAWPCRVIAGTGWPGVSIL